MNFPFQVLSLDALGCNIQALLPLLVALPASLHPLSDSYERGIARLGILRFRCYRNGSCSINMHAFQGDLLFLISTPIPFLSVLFGRACSIKGDLQQPSQCLQPLATN